MKRYFKLYSGPSRAILSLLAMAIFIQLTPLQVAGQERSNSFLKRLVDKRSASLRTSFSYNPNFPVIGQAIQFTDISTGSPASWLWDFGDGTVSTAQNPIHVYDTAGFRRVTLTAANGTNSKKVTRTLIVVPAESAATFVFSPATPGPGQTVQFADTTSGNPKAWSWNFGDGARSTMKNPSHAYVRAGTYLVSLVADTSSGSKQTNKMIIVASMSVLNASFSFTPSAPLAGQAVQFTDTSSGNPSSWSWNFGDGTTSTAQNPSHTYTTAGTKNVVLTVADSTGSNTSSQALTVATPLAASFSFSPSSPTAGQAVQFTDTSSGNPSSWSWNFGDGTTSTAQNPSHTYTTAGTKNVVLTVTNNSGSDSQSRNVTVVTALTASYTFSPGSPVANQAVQFTDTSTGSPSIWQWTFGDGATSSVQNPSHAFSSAGSYNVVLTVMNTTGQNSVTRTVTVAANTLAASFTYSPASPSTGQSVQFTDTSTGTPTAWSWNFGDGSTSSARNPSHTFTTAGSKTVALTVTNGSGSNSTSRTLTVTVPLSASFTYSPVSPSAGQSVQFTDTSTGTPIAWSWNFNDGTTSTIQNPVHTYASAGSYSVTLVATNGGASSTVTQVVLVVPSSTLAASFAYGPTSPTPGQTVQFTDTSTGSPISWSWNFGDGGSSTYQNPSHTFAEEGTYTVTLVASTAQNSSSANQTVRISTASSIIPADRVIDWSYTGVPGGIPERSTIYTTVTPSSTLSQINSAISSCPAGQVVYFAAGTYNISGTINLASKKQITLRGAGPGITILNATNSATVVSTSSAGFNYSGGAALANDAGLIKGSTSVTIAGTGSLPSSFAAGNLMLIDQDDDMVLVFARTGNWAGTRNLRHVTRITGVSGRVVSFATPIPYSFSYAQNPAAVAISATTSLCGVENMTIRASSDGDCMEFYGADRCWLNRVELTNFGNEGVLFRDSAQCEVRRCYIHTCWNFPTEAEGYGIYTWYGTSNFLIEDNIMYQCSYGILASGSSSNAIMYNYVWHMGRDAASRYWQQPGFSCNHGPHGIMNLYEGNFTERWQNDGYHGNSSYQTLFRNNIHGVNPAYVLDRRLVDLCKGSYYHTVVGNVIGSSTWTPNYYNAPSTGLDRSQGYIYVLGYPNMGNGSLVPETTFTGYPYGYPDAHVTATLMRHGNYDYYNRSTVWDSAISGRTIPASLRYSSKPAWFGSLDWPAIGPDVTGFVKDIPARWRWNRFQTSGNLADLFADTQ